MARKKHPPSPPPAPTPDPSYVRLAAAQDAYDALLPDEQFTFTTWLRSLPNSPINQLIATLNGLPQKLDEFEKEVVRYSKATDKVESAVSNYRKGPRKKRDTTRRRHEEIDRAKELGYDTPESIFKYLQDTDDKLVRKGKKGWIDPEHMMDTYDRRKAGRR